MSLKCDALAQNATLQKYGLKLAPMLLGAAEDKDVSGGIELDWFVRSDTTLKQDTLPRTLFFQSKGSGVVAPWSSFSSDEFRANLSATGFIVLYKPSVAPEDLFDIEAESEGGWDWGSVSLSIEAGFEANSDFEEINVAGGGSLIYTTERQNSLWPLFPRFRIAYGAVLPVRSAIDIDSRTARHSRLEFVANWRIPIFTTPLTVFVDGRYWNTSDLGAALNSVREEDGIYLNSVLSYSINRRTEQTWLTDVFLGYTGGRLPVDSFSETRIRIGLVLVSIDN